MNFRLKYLKEREVIKYKFNQKKADMLYLIRSYGPGKQSILKVGFSDGIENRISQYIYYNPFTLVISTREGDLILEKLIHKYLYVLGLQFNVSNRRLEEWFIEDPRILQVFHLSRKTIEKLVWRNRDEIFNIESSDSSDYSLFKYLYDKYKDEFEGVKYIVTDGNLRKTNAKEVDISFWKIYKREVEKDLLSNLDEELDQSVIDFLSLYQSTGNFSTRLKAFCEFMDTHKDQVELINQALKVVDPKFNDFYSLFGTKGCMAMKFRENLLMEKTHELDVENTLKDRIIKSFLVGTRYTRKFMKDRLGEIYLELGIKRKPKATDVESWLEMKPVLIIDSSGSKDHGFEILSVKK